MVGLVLEALELALVTLVWLALVSTALASLALVSNAMRMVSLALVAVQVVPVGLAYSEVRPRFRGTSAICFAEPLKADASGREATKAFNALLSERMQSAEQAARAAVGRSLLSP